MFYWFYIDFNNFISVERKLALFEKQARSRKIGLWIDPNPVYPSEWRKAKKSQNK